MGQIETTTTVKKFPLGGKIVKSVAISPVMITRIRTVGIDRQTLELQLEQMFQPPVGSQGGILAFTMQGHSAFNSGPRKRLTWQNFSTAAAIKFGIIRSWEEVAESKGAIMEGGMPEDGVLLIPNGKELVLLDSTNNKMPVKLIEVETFTKRTWTNKNGQPMEQRPKQAGQDGDILTFNGQPIYRNSGLSWPGTGDTFLNADGTTSERAWDEDLVIVHNNTVMGSSVRTALRAAGLAAPKQPGSPSGTGAVHAGTTQGSRPLESANQVDAGIGNTRNLTNPGPEGTRHTPDEQLEEVADKTLAEQQREEGTRGTQAGQQ